MLGTNGGQRATFGDQFSPPSMWLPRTELSLQALEQVPSPLEPSSQTHISKIF